MTLSMMTRKIRISWILSLLMVFAVLAVGYSHPIYGNPKKIKKMRKGKKPSPPAYWEHGEDVFWAIIEGKSISEACMESYLVAFRLKDRKPQREFHKLPGPGTDGYYSCNSAATIERQLKKDHPGQTQEEIFSYYRNKMLGHLRSDKVKGNEEKALHQFCDFIEKHPIEFEEKFSALRFMQSAFKTYDLYDEIMFDGD